MYERIDRIYGGDYMETVINIEQSPHSNFQIIATGLSITILRAESPPLIHTYIHTNVY